MPVNRRTFLAASGSTAVAAANARTAGAAQPTAPLAVRDPRTEYTVELLGTEVARPRLSWRLESGDGDVMQTAYRLRAGTAAAAADLWDSGLVATDACFEIAYGGAPLKPMQRVWWTVEVHDNHGRSAVSQPTWFETGLMGEWRAHWLNAESPDAEADRLAGLQWIWADVALDARPHGFRLDFDAPADLKSAEVLIAGKDWIRGVWANGEHLPTPDQPVPNWGTLVPVPAALKPGRNSVCVMVQAETTGFFPVDGGAFAALIRLHGKDGRTTRLVSGPQWKVAIAPADGWTAPGFNASAWNAAQKSGSDARNDPRPSEAPLLLRTGFKPRAKVVNARLYATALGAYDARLNGQRVTTARLMPEITVAKDHIFYQTYDVTALIQDGDNALGVVVGDGWYASPYGWRLERYGFGPAPRRLMAQLRLDYADGTSDWVVTGPDWRIGASPLLVSEIYNGEVFDARLRVMTATRPSWDQPGFDGASWRPAKTGDAPRTRILSQTGPLLKPQRTLRAGKITQPRPGVFVFDFGQNFAGYARMTVRGPAGTTVTLKFAEYLKASGEVDQANLREAKARDIYTLRGDDGGETWEPHFTYHGFRYIQVEGYPGTPTAADITGISFTSDCRETGRVTFDNALLQQVWQNALWSQRSNFYAIPTDCPQRDERMGWMGDIQVFLDAAAFNMDVDAFIRRFLTEVRAAQTPEGAYPIVVPQPLSFPDVVTAGWSEAGLILPWTLWRRYGDTSVIDANWDAMSKWMTYLAARNPDHVWRKDRGLDLGDWLSVDAVKPDDETTPRILCATAYWAFCAQMMHEMAEATGRAAEAATHAETRRRIGAAFARELVHADGVCGNGSQTSQVLSLHFGLVPEAQRAAAAKVLADDIRRRGMKLSTGFLGTPYLLDVLADAGHDDVVEGLLLQTGYPSWGYMPMKGATTMWERWNGDTGDLAMNSYNHYAFGAVVGFHYRRLAGIAPAAPGFRKLRIAPLYLPRVGAVKASYESCVGRIETAVDGDAKGVSSLTLAVPANVTAEVVLPQRAWRNLPSTARLDNGKLVFTVGSGRYRFRM